MRVLTMTEVLESFAWLKKFPDARGVERADCDDEGCFFTHPEASSIDVEYPSKVERMSWLVRFLATIGYENIHFDGALLWFNNWDVWNRSDEGVGYRIIEKMNQAAGQPKAFEAAPGHSFRADELFDAIGMLLQPMIFGWDATYLPRWSYGVDEYFLFVSHDSFVSIVTRTSLFHDRVFEALESADLHPKRGDESRMRRFCRKSS